MKPLLLMLTMLLSACTCIETKSDVVEMSIETRCKAMLTDLQVIAWQDPDAYDFDNLRDEGVEKYMCTGNEEPRVFELCQQIRKEKCL